jgi:type II secretory pathway component GspD/PulD (secretin)
MINRNGKNFAFLLVVMLCMTTVSFAQKSAQAFSATKKEESIVLKDVRLKTAIKNLAQPLKLNVVFDDRVRNNELDLELNNVTVRSALKVLLIQQKLEARFIVDNTIIIFPDNPEARQRYREFRRFTGQAEGKK